MQKRWVVCEKVAFSHGRHPTGRSRRNCGKRKKPVKEPGAVIKLVIIPEGDKKKPDRRKEKVTFYIGASDDGDHFGKPRRNLEHVPRVFSSQRKAESLLGNIPNGPRQFVFYANLDHIIKTN